MVHTIPPPSPRHLLPPLLACLPTAFASSRPPPALLPLVSPILRQRLQFLHTSTADKQSSSALAESWLSLLCWEEERAQQLVDLVISSFAFELHPVSGEIDYGSIDQLRYRRLDEETLHCRVGVPSLELEVIYLWCQGDVEGGADGWRVCELGPIYESGASMLWSLTIEEADSRVMQRSEESLHMNRMSTIAANGEPIDDDDDDEDSYWAQYDNTPGPTTPRVGGVAKHSPFPTDGTTRARSTSEADYYAQYSHVQPEMDNEDPTPGNRNPTAVIAIMGESTTLHGDAISTSMTGQGRTRPEYAPNERQRHDAPLWQASGSTTATASEINGNGTNGVIEEKEIHQPCASASFPPAAASASIERWQESAKGQPVAEVAIKQHLSTSMKSLYRLSRSAGMGLEEFDQMVRTELEGLRMMDELG